MSASRPGDWPAPTPADLAAYVDEELEPAQRQLVEVWLRAHPEIAAELEGQRQLKHLWSITTPVDADHPRWAAVLARLENSFFHFRASRSRRRQFIRLGAAMAAAACLFVVLWPRGHRPPQEPPAAEPLAVVSSDDVEIVSLHAADRDTLVVGIPPLSGPLVLAAPGDVEIKAVEPDGDGMVAALYVDEGLVTPMIVAPLDTAPARAPGNSPE